MLLYSIEIESYDFKEFVKAHSTLCEKIVEKIKEIISDLTTFFENINTNRELEILRENGKYMETVAKKVEEILAGQKNSSADSREAKYYINPKFEKEYDNWDKKNPRVVFNVGRTSQTLRNLGFKNRNILWDSKKIISIKLEHKEMTDSIIKQVPYILENPIVIMKSKNHVSLITLFGEVYSKNNEPILAIVELNPNDRNGAFLNAFKIASAYKKDSAQGLLNKSTILFIDGNKKRVRNWEKRTGLQLPFGNSLSNSNTTLPQKGNSVNSNYV